MIWTVGISIDHNSLETKHTICHLGIWGKHGMPSGQGTAAVAGVNNIYEDDSKFTSTAKPSETSIDESAVSSDWTKFAMEDSDS